jgi:hypothetical protein
MEKKRETNKNIQKRKKTDRKKKNSNEKEADTIQYKDSETKGNNNNFV